MLNSTEHEIYQCLVFKMPTLFGILTKYDKDRICEFESKERFNLSAF